MIDAAIASGDEAKVATVSVSRAAPKPQHDRAIARSHPGCAPRGEAEAEQTAPSTPACSTAGAARANWGLSSRAATPSRSGWRLVRLIARASTGPTIRLRADYQRRRITSREQFASYEPRWQFDENIFAYGLAQYNATGSRLSSRYSVPEGLGSVSMEEVGVGKTRLPVIDYTASGGSPDHHRFRLAAGPAQADPGCRGTGGNGRRATLILMANTTST